MKNAEINVKHHFKSTKTITSIWYCFRLNKAIHPNFPYIPMIKKKKGVSSQMKRICRIFLHYSWLLSIEWVNNIQKMSNEVKVAVNKDLNTYLPWCWNSSLKSDVSTTNSLPFYTTCLSNECAFFKFLLQQHQVKLYEWSKQVNYVLSSTFMKDSKLN